MFWRAELRLSFVVCEFEVERECRTLLQPDLRLFRRAVSHCDSLVDSRVAVTFAKEHFPFCNDTQPVHGSRFLGAQNCESERTKRQIDTLNPQITGTE